MQQQLRQGKGEDSRSVAEGPNLLRFFRSGRSLIKVQVQPLVLFDLHLEGPFLKTSNERRRERKQKAGCPNCRQCINFAGLHVSSHLAAPAQLHANTHMHRGTIAHLRRCRYWSHTVWVPLLAFLRAARRSDRPSKPPAKVTCMSLCRLACTSTSPDAFQNRARSICLPVMPPALPCCRSPAASFARGGASNSPPVGRKPSPPTMAFFQAPG